MGNTNQGDQRGGFAFDEVRGRKDRRVGCGNMANAEPGDAGYAMSDDAQRDDSPAGDSDGNYVENCQMKALRAAGYKGG